MANPEKVTVDKAYFDALLRRADFHTTTQLLGRSEPANVNISRVEYDSLLRVSREYELLKSALFQGGIAPETLDVLISGAQCNDQRNDSGVESINQWTQDFKDQLSGTTTDPLQQNMPGPYRGMSWRSGAPVAAFNLASGNGIFQNGGLQSQSSLLRVPTFQRQVSYDMSSGVGDTGFDDVESFDEGNQMTTDFGGIVGAHERRTIFLSGLSERTTYRDLLSVIKGGKLLNISLRSDRTGTVTFFQGAADFFTWAKRNDIYVNSKRIEIKWADRQFRLNGHIAHKIGNGATRNIVVRSAVERALTETQIRDDMEHIHNLLIIDVTFRGGDAYVSTNSVHNALFARTCMMSRSTYKGCKIEFFRDECDVPLPVRTYVSKAPTPAPPKKKPPISNRFDLLNIDGTDGSSDAENRTPSENDTDDPTIKMHRNAGVSLNFLDSEST